MKSSLAQQEWMRLSSPFSKHDNFISANDISGSPDFVSFAIASSLLLSLLMKYEFNLSNLSILKQAITINLRRAARQRQRICDIIVRTTVLIWILIWTSMIWNIESDRNWTQLSDSELKTPTLGTGTRIYSHVRTYRPESANPLGIGAYGSISST